MCTFCGQPFSWWGNADTKLKTKLLKVKMALIWVITSRLLWFTLSSRSWWKCDVEICAAGVLAAARWTWAVTAKGRGYGQYQVPHQNCDWNHKTVTDWARPWPVLTRLARAGQSGSPGGCARGTLEDLTQLAHSLHPSPRHSLPVSLSAIFPSLTSLQPFTSALPFGLIFPWAACFNQVLGLIDRSYRGGSVLCFLSGPLPLTGRLSELLLSPVPAVSIYHEERLLRSRLPLISSHF